MVSRRRVKGVGFHDDDDGKAGVRWTQKRVVLVVKMMIKMKLKNKCDLFVRLSAIGRAFLRIIALRDPGVCVVVSVEG